MMSQILVLAVVANLLVAVQGTPPSAQASHQTTEIFGTWIVLDIAQADQLRPPLRLIISGDTDGVSMTQFGIGAEQMTGRMALIPIEIAYPYRRGFVATNRRAQWAGNALVTSSLNSPQTVTYRVDPKGLLVVETRATDSDRSPRIARYVRDDPYSK